MLSLKDFIPFNKKVLTENGLRSIYGGALNTCPDDGAIEGYVDTINEHGDTRYTHNGKFSSEECDVHCD